MRHVFDLYLERTPSESLRMTLKNASSGLQNQLYSTPAFIGQSAAVALPTASTPDALRLNLM